MTQYFLMLDVFFESGEEPVTERNAVRELTRAFEISESEAARAFGKWLMRKRLALAAENARQTKRKQDEEARRARLSPPISLN